MVEAAVFCVEAGRSVLCKDELEEAVGVTICRSVVAVFFLSSSQSEEKKGKGNIYKISGKEAHSKQ